MVLPWRDMRTMKSREQEQQKRGIGYLKPRDLFRKEIEFNNIHGYDDIKDIVRRALDAEDNYNLLFIGPPASAKTLFLRNFRIQKGSIL
jgi:hypothetical protein